MLRRQKVAAERKNGKKNEKKNDCRKGFDPFCSRSFTLCLSGMRSRTQPGFFARTKKSSFGDIKTFPVRTVENAVAPRNVFQKFLEGVP